MSERPQCRDSSRGLIPRQTNRIGKLTEIALTYYEQDTCAPESALFNPVRFAETHVLRPLPPVKSIPAWPSPLCAGLLTAHFTSTAGLPLCQRTVRTICISEPDVKQHRIVGWASRPPPFPHPLNSLVCHPESRHPTGSRRVAGLVEESLPSPGVPLRNFPLAHSLPFPL